MARIDVPLIQQRGNNDCLIACIMMILKWVRNQYGNGVQFEYEELERILGLSAAGVKFCDVLNLNNEKRMKTDAVKIELSCAPSSFDFICEEIRQERPVIVFLQKSFYDSEIRHAVVVNWISKDRTEIGVLDPLHHEPINKSTGEFMEEWEKLLKYTIYVRIYEVKDLTSYLGDERE